MALYKHVRASTDGIKTNDVLEDWRYWLAVARGQAAYTIYSIWENTAAVYFTILYKKNCTQSIQCCI